MTLGRPRLLSRNSGGLWAFIDINRDGDVALSTWRGWEDGEGPSRGPGIQLVVSSCSFYAVCISAIKSKDGS